VAEVRLRIADAPDDRQPLGLPELLEADQGGVEAQLIVEPPYVFLVVGQIRPSVVIGRIAIRDDRVEAVVAAVEGDDDEYGSAGCQRARCARACSSSQLTADAPATRAAPPVTPDAMRNRRRVRVSTKGSGR